MTRYSRELQLRSARKSRWMPGLSDCVDELIGDAVVVADQLTHLPRFKRATSAPGDRRKLQSPAAASSTASRIWSSVAPPVHGPWRRPATNDPSEILVRSGPFVHDMLDHPGTVADLQSSDGCHSTSSRVGSALNHELVEFAVSGVARSAVSRQRRHDQRGDASDRRSSGAANAPRLRPSRCLLRPCYTRPHSVLARGAYEPGTAVVAFYLGPASGL